MPDFTIPETLLFYDKPEFTIKNKRTSIDNIIWVQHLT